MKAYEDTLDAVICAWVAGCALEGRAKAFGDENSAIWIASTGTAAASHNSPISHKPELESPSSHGIRKLL